MLVRFTWAAVLAGVFVVSSLAFAADSSPTVLTIHEGQFDPGELSLPAGVKLRLVIRNRDAMPAEFESFDLSREVIVPGHGEVTVFVGPLKLGSYKYFNDFNREMKGMIVVKPSSEKGN